jgi:RNase adaptor protein for sRNA GlmZ degradation
MKNLKLALCFLDEDDNIFVKRHLEVHWELKLEEDMRILLDVDMKNELASILTEQTKIDLAKGAILKLIDEMNKLLE